MDRTEAFETALKLAPGKSALLVVDMQRAFLDPGEAMEVPAARDIVPQIQSLVALFRDHDLPVVSPSSSTQKRCPCSSGTSIPSIGARRPASRADSGGPPPPASSARPMSTWCPSSPRDPTSSW